MSIWTNWDPLEEVIVGNCYSPDDVRGFVDAETHELLSVVLEETKEDLDALDKMLSDMGIKVYRPQVTKYTSPLDLINLKMSFPVAPLTPRDQYLAYGNTIYQTYTSLPNRYLDGINYGEIFREKFDEGYNWISQPPPKLMNFPAGTQWWEPEYGRNVYGNLVVDQVLWHTANMFKCGDAIIVNSAGPGTQRGLEWMRRNMPNTNIIPNTGAIQEEWGHIDHGFFMIDDDTVVCKDARFVPWCLRDKKIIDLDKLDQNSQKSYDSYLNLHKYDHEKYNTAEKLKYYLSEWTGYDQIVSFDTNVLVVDSKNIITTNIPKIMVKAFAGHGINVHVCKLRHQILWDGGIHCSTLDIKRKGIRRKVINL